jgi:hypothetical protein
MDYVDTDNIPVAPSCTYNVVDVNMAALLFCEGAGNVAPVNTAS